MKKKDIVNLVLLILVVTLAAVTYYKRSYTTTGSEFVLDTIVEITVTTKNQDNKELLDKTFNQIRDYENRYSCHKPGSWLYEINNAQVDSFKIDKDFYRMLMVSNNLYQATGGLYDVSVGVLSELWDFNKAHIPAADSIKFALTQLGFNKLQFGEDFLKKPVGIELNLGSIAKGYIIDQTVEFLQQNGVKSGIVNAGGDIRIFGEEKSLRIGIQHPRKERGEIIGTIEMGNKAVVTSGDYERFFMVDGKRYHHIINPHTGYPSENAVSVTVIADNATLADAYSTALFLMQPQSAMELVNSKPEVEAMIVYLENNKINILKSNEMDKYLVE